MKIASIAFLTFFLFSIHFLSAQTGIKFGFKAGYSIATQYGIHEPDIPYEVDTDVRHGFAGGAFLFFPVTEAFGVQQEFLFAQKGSHQHVSMLELPVSTSSHYTLNYFELPMLFRYTIFNIKDVGIYGYTGFALSMLLSGEYKVDGVINIEGIDFPFGESGDTDGLDVFDYSFVYGLGADFTLFNKTCFFEYRQTIGWNTLLMPTFEGEEPAPLRNQDYILALGIFLN
jgi:hypothetical protein